MNLIQGFPPRQVGDAEASGKKGEALRPLQQPYRTDYVLPAFVTCPINGHFRAYLDTLIELLGQERIYWDALPSYLSGSLFRPMSTYMI